MTTTADLFRLLFEYTAWARDRLLKAAEGLTEEEYVQPNGFTYGSIRGILTHGLAAETGGMRRWTGQMPATGINQEGLPTVEALASRWAEETAALRAFLPGLDDAALEQEVIQRRPDGTEIRRVLMFDMMQIVNHATQHRAEAAEALTQIGRSPGDLDFSVFLRVRG